jgi:predicted 3-demethylubiquinone-9 3-methyltransferase (glyoxalase superfamily)
MKAVPPGKSMISKRPGRVTDAMLTMVKLDIAALESAARG